MRLVTRSMTNKRHVRPSSAQANSIFNRFEKCRPLRNRPMEFEDGGTVGTNHQFSACSIGFTFGLFLNSSDQHVRREQSVGRGSAVAALLAGRDWCLPIDSRTTIVPRSKGLQRCQARSISYGALVGEEAMPLAAVQKVSTLASKVFLHFGSEACSIVADASF